MKYAFIFWEQADDSVRFKREINDIIWVQQSNGYNSNVILQLIDNYTTPYTYYRLNLNKDGELFLGL